MAKIEALEAHLEQALEGGPFWGRSDCYVWPADWVVVSGWPDPAGPWRGRYASAVGGARIVRRAGGAEALWIEAAARCGLNVTVRPIAGDVGLVRRETVAAHGPTLGGLVGGVCLGGGEWAVSTPAGLRTGRWAAARAWRIPWRTR